jgi:hypothetical protein
MYIYYTLSGVMSRGNAKKINKIDLKKEDSRIKRPDKLNPARLHIVYFKYRSISSFVNSDTPPLYSPSRMTQSTLFS